MNDLVSIRKAARILGVHENTIRNWIAKGTLTPVKIPGPSGFRRLIRHDVENLSFSISQKKKGILKCNICGKVTTTLEASFRKFNNSHCGYCDGNLE